MTRIFLDAGHGGKDPGAVGYGLKEKDLTLAISLKIRDYLNEYQGVAVKLSRTKDQTLSLKQRTDMANTWGANFLLSVHINAGGGTGYEDFIYNKLSDSSKTAKIRNTIHAEVAKAINMSNRGKKKANYHMLRESNMDAVLTENGFIDNKRDAEKMKDTKWINAVAKAHAVGIAKSFGLKKKQEEKPKTQSKPTTNNKLYRVQVGAYADRKNAEKQAAELKKKGYSVYITQ